VLAVVLASFILVAMLALAGAICGLLVSLGLTQAADPGPVRAWRAALLVAVAALALLVAGADDLYIVPDITM